MKGILVLALLVFIIGGIVAECNDNQIDINTASEDKLDEITYVGPATAQSIVSKRPFEEVNDLIHVNGIGEIKLEAIKEEGLACVSKEPPEEEKPIEDVLVIQLEDQESDIENKFYNYRNIDEFLDDEPLEEVLETTEELLVELVPQTIKGDENSQSEIKGSYAIYGLILFCVLLAALFIVKKKNDRRNEFS